MAPASLASDHIWQLQPIMAPGKRSGQISSFGHNSAGMQQM